MAKQVRPIPKGCRTVTPHLIVRGGVEAIKFYKKAFGAKELMRSAGPGGKIMHAELELGDSHIYVTDEMPEMGQLSPQGLNGSPVSIALWVENVDKAFAKAVKAGAKVIMPVGDQFWGDRFGMLEDPFGHKWSMSTHIKDMTPKEIAKAAAAAFAAMGDGPPPG